MTMLLSFPARSEATDCHVGDCDIQTDCGTCPDGCGGICWQCDNGDHGCNY
jgi:hypothetical protein